MIRVRTPLAAVVSVLVIGLASQAQAQFVRTGPRVTGNGAHPVAPPKPPPPEVAPVTVTANQPTPPPAKPASPPVDGALPGGVLGPGEEGVGALIRKPEPAPAQLAQTSKVDAADLSSGLGDSPAAAPQAAPAPAAKAAAPRHMARHRPRTPKPAEQPQS